VDYGESFVEALATMRGNPLRASLAGLAMAAAVATTAITVTALNGLATQAKLTSARAFGSDTFVLAKVFGTGLNRRDLADKLARNPDITRSDVRFLDRYAGARVLYSPITQRAADVTAGGRKFENASVNGTGARLAEIRDIGLARGRFFSPEEEARAAQVAVIGAGVADTLFPSGDPLGASIRIGGRGFVVIGVQALQGMAGGASLDRYVWLPLQAYERVFGAPASLQVFARAADTVRTAEAEDHARVSLRARRQLGPGVADNFDLLAPEAGRSFVDTITERAGAAGPPISLMALLAAIVVVANTTLVSVSQRTREIGVRRALGATRRQVLVEVLAESGVIAFVGGVAGLALAGAALRGAASIAGLPLSLNAATVASSLAAATASGVLAGWYPARRAVRADIVTALRSE
jgi:putative ABC transport system permease protein